MAAILCSMYVALSWCMCIIHSQQVIYVRERSAMFLCMCMSLLFYDRGVWQVRFNVQIAI